MHRLHNKLRPYGIGGGLYPASMEKGSQSVQEVCPLCHLDQLWGQQHKGDGIFLPDVDLSRQGIGSDLTYGRCSACIPFVSCVSWRPGVGSIYM